MKIKSLRNKVTCIILLSLFFLNCFSPNQKYITGREYYYDQESGFASESEQFVSGEPYKIIDYPGHYFFSLIAKLFLWNWDFANHKIDEETKRVVKKYFQDNNIRNVKVRFNQYAPFDDLSRLYKNNKINPLMKYSFGLIVWIIKAIFPERLFAGFGIFFIGGGDYYDPYTNTVHIFSNSIPIALHESGHAKDFSQTRNATSYSITRILPFTALYQEAIASEDAVAYLRRECLLKEEAKAYRQLPPAYSSYIASAVGLNFIVLAIPGHTASYQMKRNFEKKDIPECQISASTPGATITPVIKPVIAPNK